MDDLVEAEILAGIRSHRGQRTSEALSMVFGAKMNVDGVMFSAGAWALAWVPKNHPVHLLLPSAVGAGRSAC